MSEQVAASSVLVFVGAIALTSVGCGANGGTVPAMAGGAGSGAAGSPSGAAGAGGASGASGGNGASGAALEPGRALPWNQDGFVAADSNPFAIQGPFYFYSDCDPPTGLPCTMPDSALTGPDGKGVVVVVGSATPPERGRPPRRTPGVAQARPWGRGRRGQRCGRWSARRACSPAGPARPGR